MNTPPASLVNPGSQIRQALFGGHGCDKVVYPTKDPQTQKFCTNTSNAFYEEFEGSTLYNMAFEAKFQQVT